MTKTVKVTKGEPKIVKTELRQIRIPPPNYELLEIELSNKNTGSTLVVHRFSEKSINQLKETDKGNKGSRKAPRPARDPYQEYQGSLYRMPSNPNIYALPAAGFKKAMVRAAKPIDGITMTDIQMAFWVLEDEGGMVAIKGEPRMREDIVRLSGVGRPPQIRYRGEFVEWSTKLRIRYDADLFAAEEIINLCYRAGQSVGWGELRFEKGFSCGAWNCGKINTVKLAS